MVLSSKSNQLVTTTFAGRDWRVDCRSTCAGFTDNSSVSVISTPDQKELYTMTESVAGTYRADLGSLATLGPVKFNDKLKGLLTTAHPTLMEDGTLINIINGVSFC